jgi:hypothetical protein
VIIFNGKKDSLIKIWGTYRDSLSSVAIDMQGWQKMYATDKKGRLYRNMV